jgi:hypothetical protein
MSFFKEFVIYSIIPLKFLNSMWPIVSMGDISEYLRIFEFFAFFASGSDFVLHFLRMFYLYARIVSCTCFTTC